MCGGGSLQVEPPLHVGWKSRADSREPICQSRFLNRLRLARGYLVTYDELIEALYYDDPDGGPLDAHNCLTQFALLLKKRGYSVIRVRGRGYRYAWVEWEVCGSS